MILEFDEFCETLKQSMEVRKKSKLNIVSYAAIIYGAISPEDEEATTQKILQQILIGELQEYIYVDELLERL